MSISDGTGGAATVDSLRWYHTIELPDGIVTPGEYDLRGILEKLPLPASLAGKRCLDVGSRDGFYAFEMERRGAAEIVSLDIDEPTEIHFPRSFDAPPPEVIQGELDAGHRAFEAAKVRLSSQVQRRTTTVYDLSPEEFGSFDFAVIATLLLHLRDPVRALSAVADVLQGYLLVNDPVIPGLASLDPRPRAEPLMAGGPFWWLCNPAGQRRLVEAAGLEVVASGRPYLIPWGPGYTRPGVGAALRGRLGGLPRRLLQRHGALHAWTLAAKP